MNKLPNEIVLHILLFVSDEDLIRSTSLVCKQFRELSTEESLWIPRWKNWRHNGGLAFLEHSRLNYIYMMQTWREWLWNLQSAKVVRSTLSSITDGLDNTVYFPFYIPNKWINTLENVKHP